MTISIQQRLQLYNHRLPNCLIHLKQPNSNMHGRYMLFMKLITIEKVSIPPRDIHKSKLAKIIVIDARFGKTYWWSMVSLTMIGNTSSTKEDQEGNKTQRLWRNTNLWSQLFSQMDKGL